MGSATSKSDRNEALRLCKQRRKFIRQAIVSRYALAAAHVSYVQSLRNIGIALRRYAEAEVLIESSSSTSSPELLDKTPSNSPYPSPSPPHNADLSDSPLYTESSFSPSVPKVNYMRQGAASAVTGKITPPPTGFLNDESITFSVLPPPPPPESEHAWDYFDTSDDIESFKNARNSDLGVNYHDIGARKKFNDEKEDNESQNELLGHEWEHKDPPLLVSSLHSVSLLEESNAGPEGDRLGLHSGVRRKESPETDNQSAGSINCKVRMGNYDSKERKEAEKDSFCDQREDPSEFITHRAKDFLSSIRVIEHRFFRASESGKEVSRLLEANKIRVTHSEERGEPSLSSILAAFQLVCCRRRNTIVSHEPPQKVEKIITWKRSSSSCSTSSKNPLANDNDDSGSDFIEDYCIIAGSHSSTLDRLYAWERKLYDEVKAIETLRKKYDQKCEKLRHQFAKDLRSQAMDKTRAVIKDLHSQIRVAIHAVDSISLRIEKIRDEELQPQLMELITGLIRMWKAMLECHHGQYITISLAYHSRKPAGAIQEDAYREVLTQLRQEIEYFGLSFADWINSHTSYIGALNGWLQQCFLLPREPAKCRRLFSPCPVLAPPLFVLFRDWSAGIKSLPSQELGDAAKNFLTDVQRLIEQQSEQAEKKQALDLNGEEEPESRGEEHVDRSANLFCIHARLTKVLELLTKFSEVSLKMYEDVRKKVEASRTACLVFGGRHMRESRENH